MIFLFLPPIFDENEYSIDKEQQLHTSAGRLPQVSIERIHKSLGLIVYEIGFLSSITNVTESISIISSQADPMSIRRLYNELSFQPIDEISRGACPRPSIINIFGIVADFSGLLYTTTSDSTIYSIVCLFDFDLKETCRVRLWRGMAVWINSLSIGCRLQIRNLILKDDGELSSTGSTEIFLLGHGHLTEIPKSLNLSSRHANLLEKERQILNFLAYESLRIPPRTKLVAAFKRTRLILKGPIYLEWRDSSWYSDALKEEDTAYCYTRVKFSFFDAKIWNNCLLEDLQEIEFKDLKVSSESNSFEFLESSKMTIKCGNSLMTSSSTCKWIEWRDLVSSSCIQYGIYRIEGILSISSNDTINATNNNSASFSFGNLSLIDAEGVPEKVLVLKSADLSLMVYPVDVDKRSFDNLDTLRTFLIRIRTVLNDGNVNEVIRKIVNIIE